MGVVEAWLMEHGLQCNFSSNRGPPPHLLLTYDRWTYRSRRCTSLTHCNPLPRLMEHEHQLLGSFANIFRLVRRRHSEYESVYHLRTSASLGNTKEEKYSHLIATVNAHFGRRH
ncbi:hypothetical protein AHF37_02964 [Paragonimus kellicotti]|nr:hypothetical protein AHF37_02964 [Paragonimus kellicotti]